MWVAFTVIGYLVLALLIPVSWSLGRVWRSTRGERPVSCPATGAGATVRLDGAYAMRMHALGNPELRVLSCSRWPEHLDCSQECLVATARA